MGGLDVHVVALRAMQNQVLLKIHRLYSLSLLSKCSWKQIRVNEWLDYSTDKGYYYFGEYV